MYLLSGQLPLVAEIYSSESWVRWVVCYAAAIAELKTINPKAGLSKSTQFCLTLDLLNSELAKASWKQTIDEHINAYWVNKIKLEASDKSSLRFLNTENYEIGKVRTLCLEKCRFQSYGN